MRVIDIRIKDLTVEGYVATLSFADFHISFTAEMTEDSKYNKAEIVIMNMMDKRLDSLELLVAEIWTGYDSDDLSMIYSGNIHSVVSVTEQGTTTTTISCLDGFARNKKSVVNQNFKAGVSSFDILKSMLKKQEQDLKIPFVFLNDSKELLEKDVYKNSISLFGISYQEINKLLAKNNCKSRINNGTIEIDSRESTTGPIVKLDVTEDSFVSKPTPIEWLDKATVDGKTVGNLRRGIRFKALIDPLVKPGVQLNMKVDGEDYTFFCKKVTYTGSNYDTPWYVDVEGENRDA